MVTVNPTDRTPSDSRFMRRALELAERGAGAVEPNPMVGCVLVHADQIVAEGWHRAFGGPHAEIEAIRAAGDRARGATMYVSLEPCCHHGKTPPCTSALIAAGVGRVVVGQVDPYPDVAGRGIKQLNQAGIPTVAGVLEEEARQLNAPYLKLLRTGRPWVIAKWAMSLDGKIATRTGHSQWISNSTSREWVHQLRGRVDAVIVGIGTVQADDPLLTARPPGPRRAARVVLDTDGQLSDDSQLLRTADASPVIVAAGPKLDPTTHKQLQSRGIEVVVLDQKDYGERWLLLLDTLGARRMTNVLVEGGAGVLGTARDTRSIDEVHVFIGPQLIGGADAPLPVAGLGEARIDDGLRFDPLHFESSGGDLHVWGRNVLASSESQSPKSDA